MSLLYLCNLVFADGQIIRKIGITHDWKKRIQGLKSYSQAARVDLLDLRNLGSKAAAENVEETFKIRWTENGWIGKKRGFPDLWKTEIFSCKAPITLPSVEELLAFPLLAHRIKPVEKIRTVSIKSIGIHGAGLQGLEWLSNETGLTPSEIVRRALDNHLQFEFKRLGKTKPLPTKEEQS